MIASYSPTDFFARRTGRASPNHARIRVVAQSMEAIMAELDSYTPLSDMSELPARPIRRKTRELYSRLNPLRTESKLDFARLLADFRQDIGPRNFIEETYVNDLASDTWDIMRYRRIVNGILNNALRTALADTLRSILLPLSPYLNYARERWLAAANLAYQWLFDPEIKRQVLSLLQEAGYDESTIEARAYRLVADDLQKADRMLNAAMARRDKTLRSIAMYRKSFASQLKRSSDRILAADEVSSIADGAGD
jgi:hypothetical protein